MMNTISAIIMNADDPATQARVADLIASEKFAAFTQEEYPFRRIDQPMVDDGARTWPGRSRAAQARPGVTGAQRGRLAKQSLL